MNIEKKLIKYNFTSNTNKPKYIVIHDTGNTSKGANTDAHFNYFNGGNRNASAHFFVDNKKVLQVVEIKDSAWHCGKKYVSNPKVTDCNNQNSVGIEICVNSDCNVAEAIKKAQELVLHLMDQYSIPEEKVITHRDATGKNCPANLTWKMDFVENKVEDDYTKAINILHSKGVINSPTYWLGINQDNINVEYVKGLIKNFASKL
jgi:N-acetylmuramoyl-L-alanine amidase